MKDNMLFQIWQLELNASHIEIHAYLYIGVYLCIYLSRCKCTYDVSFTTMKNHRQFWCEPMGTTSQVEGPGGARRPHLRRSTQRGSTAVADRHQWLGFQRAKPRLVVVEL